MVNSTDVVELELKSKRFSLSMRKKEAIAPPEVPAQVGTWPYLLHYLFSMRM